MAGLRAGTAAVALALAVGGQAAAQEADAGGGGTVYALDSVTVTATRTPSDVFSVPSTVTVIDAEEIEEALATDIKDLIRFEPGISVPSSPSRFGAALASTGRDGNSGFTIRGMGGNRVLFQVDGVRVPDGFSFGPAAFGRGDQVDLDILKSVEIVRGPASALYGSDGLAGVVSFIAKDPGDILGQHENFAARVRAAYAGADDSWATGLTAAGRRGDWSALVAYTRRDGHEQDNQGENDALDSTRTAPNPQDIVSNSMMARLVFEPGEAHRLRLTGEYGDREVVTQAYSGRSLPPYGATSVLDLDGVDSSERRRVALDYTFESDAGPIRRIFGAIYFQDSDTTQFSAEDRNTAADRTRLTSFQNEVWGATAQLESRFLAGGVEHRLLLGGDYAATTQAGLRDGTVPPMGETFPTRPFPNTDYVVTGLFMQDEIRLLDGRLTLFPALRYDAYDLTPHPDALYVLPTSGQSGSRVSPRLGIVAWPTENIGLFFNYAQGFKAPSPSQVNSNFANPLFGYTSIPNPDLDPETSEAVELGVRFRGVSLAGGAVRASVTAFAGRYEDFIEQAQVGGSFTPSDPAVYQFVNLGEVEISGIEGRLDAAWDNGLGLNVSASLASGDRTDAGVSIPLESVDPWKVVAGLSYDASEHRWGGQAIMTHVARKEADRTAAGNFRPDAFTILDVTAYWRLTDAAMLRVGAFNLTDETYWWWSDVRGLSSASTVRDAWTQPGRNVSVSISYRF
ncbi:MAG: TonB-dependent hemoglobin/transferrin/lactoferrin family receptor [Caulobacter sp.]|nr:TonB-dependent hemoglobin/transferrin/lactoferrin family receptor [Caulobacter sp.]